MSNADDGGSKEGEGAKKWQEEAEERRITRFSFDVLILRAYTPPLSPSPPHHCARACMVVMTGISCTPTHKCAWVWVYIRCDVCIRTCACVCIIAIE